MSTTTASGVEFCKLEYWNPSTGEWEIGHAGVNLVHPDRYPDRLWKNGKLGRVTVYADGSITEVDRIICPRQPKKQPSCDHCDLRHAEPHDGSCLL